MFMYWRLSQRRYIANVWELIPRAGLPDEHFLANELANFPPDERQWISRVISSSPEDSDGRKVSSRKKKG